MELQILGELGVWGVGILAGSLGFTEIVKRSAKNNNANVPWWVWIVLPLAIAGVGVVGMVMAGVTEPKMALLLWVIIAFTGPILYFYIIKPRLDKKRAEIEGG